MKIVNGDRAVTVRLIHPNPNGYLMLAAEVGAWAGALALPSRRRRALLDGLVPLAGRLGEHHDVEDVTLFRGRLRPPGEGTALLRRHRVVPARYDVVVLVRTTAPGSAAELRNEPVYKEIVETARGAASRVYEFTAHNARRIGEVDHRPDHAFLFNYFHAEDTKTLLDVWQYTAGWFQERTDLPNSTLMQPLKGEREEYGIVNHASWPRLRAFLPDLLFRPTFRSFVLANFRTNGVAAQPIIYRRVATFGPANISDLGN